MRKYLYPALLFTLLLVAFQACDSASPVAPNSSTLFITANPTQVALRGSSTITVTGFKPDGNPLNRGTQIVFQATFGTVDPPVAAVDNTGRAVTVFTSDGTLPSGGEAGPAQATVTASLSGGGSGGGGEGGGGGGAAVTAEIQIGETKSLLTVTVTPNVLGLGETAEVLAQVRNADGSNFGAGGRVELRTNLGRLERSSLVTDASGEARTTFNAGNDPGTATLTGFVGSSDEATAEVTIESQKPNLIISANPSNLAVLQTAVISILARDNNDVPLGAGEPIQLFASLGSIRSQVVTDASGRAEAVFNSGTQAGTATIQAVLDNSDPASVQITIRDAVRDFIFTTNPTAIDRPAAGGEGESIRLTGTVRNAQGEPVPNILITFASRDVGGTFTTISGAPSNGTVQTGGDGVGELILTVTRAGVGDTRTSFNIEATVVSEGQTFTEINTITVRGN